MPLRASLAGLVVLLLLAAGASGAPTAGPGPIIVPDESAGPLLEPPVISSSNGVLKADVTLKRAGPPGSNDPILVGGLPTYSNPVLPPPSPSGGANPPKFPLNFAAGYAYTTTDGTTYAAQFPAPTLHLQPGDTLDLTVHDRLAQAPGPTLPAGAVISNIHTHGLVVSPLDDGDNVYRTMTSDGSFRTRVVIPSNHQPGVDWYHAHRHGYVADQVYGGLAGALQIGDPLDPWAQYKGKYTERLLALTLGFVKHDQATGDRYLADPSPNGAYGTTWRKYVNGEFNPTITIRPGETQIWTFANMSRNGNFNLGVTDGDAQNPWQSTIFSYDGNTNNVLPRKTTLAPPVPFNYNGPTVVDPGERMSMAITAPTEPGTYYLIDNMQQRLTPQQQFWALATIHVEGDPATEPPPNLTPTGPVPDLYTATPDQHRTFQWSIGTSPQGTTDFPINGFLFPDAPIVPLQVGQVEEWLLVNTSGVDHVFHIHQTDIAVIQSGFNTISTSASATGPYRYTSLRDSVDIPPDSSVIIRFRVSPELGKYVFHCHILPHEDGGMMMGVLAVPNADQRRFALGSLPGQSAQVIVRDGSGRRLGALTPGGGSRGIATATGELTSDLTEDVVAAPATPGAAPFISVYDGKSLQQIARFRPFGSERVGVSLATGNIDDQGQAEIIAGRVGPGTSLVRIFRPDGTLVRELTGTLGGTLPSGVSVASADFDGDNFDDVAVGAGRGADPIVVGLSGLVLTMSTPPFSPLFSFTAAGGAKAGVNLAAGYYDPLTQPGIVANLVTTPQSGKVAGWAQVWVPYTPNHDDPSGGSMLPPHQISAFRPLGRSTDRPLSLQVGRLGHNGLDALAAWLDPRKAVYVSIDDAGVISRIQTPITAGAVMHTERAPNAAARAAYHLVLDASDGVRIRITRNGAPLRRASVGVTYTMLDMPMAPSTESLRETTPGVYSGAGPAVGMAGRWQVALRVTPRGKRSFTVRLVSALRPASG